MASSAMGTSLAIVRGMMRLVPPMMMVSVRIACPVGFSGRKVVPAVSM